MVLMALMALMALMVVLPGCRTPLRPAFEDRR